MYVIWVARNLVLPGIDCQYDLASMEYPVAYLEGPARLITLLAVVSAYGRAMQLAGGISVCGEFLFS